MDTNSISQIATLIFAGFAAIVSWLNFLKSGSQKVAQFRKEWIENLRTHLAEYNSLRFRIQWTTAEINSAIESKDEKKVFELRAINDEAFRRISYVIAYVRLMLNDGEPLHDDLNSLLTKHIDVEFDVADDDRKKFMKLCRQILKAEWEKTKSEM